MGLIYPNPGSTELNIEFQDEISTVELYSMNGVKIATYNSAQFDISNLANGIYILKPTTIKGTTFSAKFIKK